MNNPHRICLILLLLVSSRLGAVALAEAPREQAVHPLTLVLVKSTLIAVNHGNISGNYAVLRELGSERFQQTNTPADLAASFAELRRNKLDLSPILVTDPQLTKPPAQDQEGRLHLEGYCPLLHNTIRFHLVYQTLPHGWLIDQISIAIVPQNQQPTSNR
jgi:hypothetical protein